MVVRGNNRGDRISYDKTILLKCLNTFEYVNQQSCLATTINKSVF